MRTALITCCVFAATLLCANVADAATSATTTMLVSATVAANCTINATGLSFGAYDPIVTNATTDLDQTSTISTTCTAGASASVSLNQGQHGGTDEAPVGRHMAGTGDAVLAYELYSDEQYNTAWDSATKVQVTSDGASHDTTVYGRVTAGQNVPAGDYTDTVTATIAF